MAKKVNWVENSGFLITYCYHVKGTEFEWKCDRQPGSERFGGQKYILCFFLKEVK